MDCLISHKINSYQNANSCLCVHKLAYMSCYVIRTPFSPDILVTASVEPLTDVPHAYCAAIGMPYVQFRDINTDLLLVEPCYRVSTGVRTCETLINLPLYLE